MTDARPGYARFTADDKPEDIERKMREAFSPLRAMQEGYARAFDPKHRWRDIRTGRFVEKRP